MVSSVVSSTVGSMRCRGKIRDRGRSWGSSSGKNGSRWTVLGVGRIVPGEA